MSIYAVNLSARLRATTRLTRSSKMARALNFYICVERQGLHGNTSADLSDVSIVASHPSYAAQWIILTGLGSGKNLVYTSFTAAKSSILARNTLTLTALARLEPPASRTAPLQYCLVLVPFAFPWCWCCILLTGSSRLVPEMMR